MSSQGVATDQTLEQIARAIVERVQPRRIVLFGSRARGDAQPHSDYDLMVELEFDDFHRCRMEVSRAANGPGTSVDVLLRKPGELEARRDDPGRTDWDIWREGIVVYPPGAPPLAFSAPTTASAPSAVREGSGLPPESTQDWLARAAEDLLTIENSLSGQRVPWGAVCFHSQQAAEKYLKALVIQRFIRPPRTHDLAELVGAARGAGYDLPDFTEECEALKDYAIDVRYPENVPIPDEARGRIVLAAAQRIIAAVQRDL